MVQFNLANLEKENQNNLKKIISLTIKYRKKILFSLLVGSIFYLV